MLSRSKAGGVEFNRRNFPQLNNLQSAIAAHKTLVKQNYHLMPRHLTGNNGKFSYKNYTKLKLITPYHGTNYYNFIQCMCSICTFQSTNMTTVLFTIFTFIKKKKKIKNLAELSKNKSCTLQLIQLPCAGLPEIYNFKPFLHSNSGHGHTSKAHLFSITNN